MKSYLVQYEIGNGYHCGCCRSTYRVDEVHEFESDEATKEFIKLHNERSRKEHDSCIIGAYILAQENPIYEE